MVISTSPAIVLGWWIIQQGQWESGPSMWNFGVLGAAGIIGGLAYVITAGLLGIKEVKSVMSRIRRQLG